MKKLIVVALALVIACVFVGCGAGALLEGTQWYEEYTNDGVTYREDWSFEKDNVLKFSKTVVGGGDVNDPAIGVWQVNDSNILEITAEENVTKILGIVGTWHIDMGTKDLLTLTRVVTDPKKNNEITLKRVKDAE